MLEKVNLKTKFPRREYQRMLPAWQHRLYDLEKACWDQGVPSILLFEGWDAAGKGSTIATLTARLDPRGFKLHPISPPRTFEQRRPWLWRFWLRTPNRGEMAIFDHSWYTHVLSERVEGQVSERECREAFRDILDFERALSDDGCVIVKFWLHISRKEQKKRFEALARDPLENWRITEEDWKRHKKYDAYLLAAEEMLEWTESEYGPWTIVEATSRWHTRRRVFETAIRALENRLGSKAPPPREPSEDDERDRQLREEHQALDPAEAGS